MADSQEIILGYLHFTAEIGFVIAEVITYA